MFSLHLPILCHFKPHRLVTEEERNSNQSCCERGGEILAMGSLAATRKNYVEEESTSSPTFKSKYCFLRVLSLDLPFLSLSTFPLTV